MVLGKHSSWRASWREQLRLRRRGFACFFLCYRAAKSGTSRGEAAAPNQATEQQETTQQYQQRFVHFLAENKEWQRSAFSPLRFQVVSPLLSTQIGGGKKLPLPKRLPAPSSSENSFSLSVPTPTHSSCTSPSIKWRKITKSSVQLVPSCRTASPLPAPQTLFLLLS